MGFLDRFRRRRTTPPPTNIEYPSVDPVEQIRQMEHDASQGQTSSGGSVDVNRNTGGGGGNRNTPKPSNQLDQFQNIAEKGMEIKTPSKEDIEKTKPYYRGYSKSDIMKLGGTANIQKLPTETPEQYKLRREQYGKSVIASTYMNEYRKQEVNDYLKYLNEQERVQNYNKMVDEQPLPYGVQKTYIGGQTYYVDTVNNVAYDETGKISPVLGPAPKGVDQYKQYIADRNPVTATLDYTGQKIQGYVGKLESGNQYGQSIAQTGAIPMLTQTIPYFTPAGPGLLLASGVGQFTPSGQREVSNQATYYQKKYGVPVGITKTGLNTLGLTSIYFGGTQTVNQLSRVAGYPKFQTRFLSQEVYRRNLQNGKVGSVTQGEAITNVKLNPFSNGRNYKSIQQTEMSSYPVGQERNVLYSKTYGQYEKVGGGMIGYKPTPYVSVEVGSSSPVTTGPLIQRSLFFEARRPPLQGTRIESISVSGTKTGEGVGNVNLGFTYNIGKNKDILGTVSQGINKKNPSVSVGVVDSIGSDSMFFIKEVPSAGMGSQVVVSQTPQLSSIAQQNAIVNTLKQEVIQGQRTGQIITSTIPVTSGVMFSTPLLQKQENTQVNRQLQSTAPLDVIGLKVGSGTRQKLSQQSLQSPVEILSLNQPQMQIPLSRQFQVPRSRQLQSNKLNQMYRLLQRARQSPSIRQQPRIPIRPMGWGLGRSSSSSIGKVLGNDEDVQLSVKRFGKWLDIGKATSYGKAKEKGINLIDTSLGASFRLTSKSTGKPLDLGTLPYSFRRSKKDSFTAVELPSFRLSRRPEVSEIKMFKRKSKSKIF